jgi:uncharacterized coiled-coil DUF342 family protein
LVRRKTASELELAEIKLESLRERRDLLNAEAQQMRQERDLLHEKKREIAERLRSLQDRRASFAAEARAHRQTRDELQAKAKALLELKRKSRATGQTDVGGELRALTRHISQMEMRQQTASLSVSVENVLIGELKESMKRLKVLQGLRSEQDQIAKEIRDLDSGITDLFHAAEKEHTAAVALSAKARAVHEEMEGPSREIAVLELEGNEKHEAYLAARAKADEIHGKVVEMRGKVLSIKGAKRAEAREAHDILRQQNRSVRAALLDVKKLEDSADAALRALLEKGRVEIGR